MTATSGRSPAGSVGFSSDRIGLARPAGEIKSPQIGISGDSISWTAGSVLAAVPSKTSPLAQATFIGVTELIASFPRHSHIFLTGP